MKVCQKCGNMNQDSSVCCTGCGNRLDTPVSSFSGKVVDAVKKAGRSPLFLIATISVTLTALLNVWYIIEAVINYSNGFYYDNATFLGEIVTFIIYFIMQILVALGMFLFYSACISKKETVSTAGLTIIKVIQIIELVFSTLGMVLLLVVAIILMAIPNVIGIDNILSSLNSSYGYDIFGDYLNTYSTNFTVVWNIILIILIVVIIAFGVLLFLYFMKTLKTIKSVKMALSTGQPNNKASMYIVVINFIISVFGIIGIVSDVFSFIAGTYDAYTFLLTTISNILTLITLVTIAIGIIVYRSKMKALMDGGQSVPVAPRPAVQPQAAPQPVVQPTPEQVTPSPKRFCTSCGAEADDDSAFCLKCGNKL